MNQFYYRWNLEKHTKFDPYASVLNYLSITPGRWEIKYKEMIRGRSGKDHLFDAVYKSERNEIVTVMIAPNSSDVSKMAKEFNYNSEDIGAKRKFLITCGEIEPDAIENFKSQGISVLMLPSIFCKSEGIGDEAEIPDNIIQDMTENDGGEAQRKRSRANIIMDLISTIRENSNQIPLTRLFYACNLNHRMGKGIIEDLERSGIVCIKKSGSNRNLVELTQKGILLANDYEFIRDILGK